MPGVVQLRKRDVCKICSAPVAVERAEVGEEQVIIHAMCMSGGHRYDITRKRTSEDRDPEKDYRAMEDVEDEEEDSVGA